MSQVAQILEDVARGRITPEAGTRLLARSRSEWWGRRWARPFWFVVCACTVGRVLFEDYRRGTW